MEGKQESKRKVSLFDRDDKKSFPKNATTGYDGKLIKFEQPTGLLSQFECRIKIDKTIEVA